MLKGRCEAEQRGYFTRQPVMWWPHSLIKLSLDIIYLSGSAQQAGHLKFSRSTLIKVTKTGSETLIQSSTSYKRNIKYNI